MDPIPTTNEKPADSLSPGQAVPMPTTSDQPPAYVQYDPGQTVYPPPAQGGYPPPAQGSAYPPTQGPYPPTQGPYPPTQGPAYPPTQYQYPGHSQTSVPTTVTGAATSQIIIAGARTCTRCQSGFMQEQFTACGILCAIFFFPFGILCCLAMREYRCSHCNANF